MIPVLGPLWARLRRSPGSLLMLDFDGTLAPFRESRLQTRPYPGIQPVLETLASDSRTRVVLVTGRPAKSLQNLLRLHPSPEIWGSHGAERLRPDGTYQEPDLDSARKEGLRRAHWSALLGLPPHKVERKPVSVAAHWRGIPQGERGRIRKALQARWTTVAERYNLQLLPFDGGLEMVVPGFHKGRAVARLLEETDPTHPAAYLGDDLTDERAFAALGTRGLSVLVRGAWRPTRAQAWIRPPEEVLAFLEGWCFHTLLRNRRSRS